MRRLLLTFLLVAAQCTVAQTLTGPSRSASLSEQQGWLAKNCGPDSSRSMAATRECELVAANVGYLSSLGIGGTRKSATNSVSLLVVAGDGIELTDVAKILVEPLGERLNAQVEIQAVETNPEGIRSALRMRDDGTELLLADLNLEGPLRDLSNRAGGTEGLLKRFRLAAVVGERPFALVANSRSRVTRGQDLQAALSGGETLYRVINNDVSAACARAVFKSLFQDDRSAPAELSYVFGRQAMGVVCTELTPTSTRSGHAIAISQQSRLPIHSLLPTMKSLGLDTAVFNVIGVFVSASTSDQDLRRVTDAIFLALREPLVRYRMENELWINVP